MTKIKTPEIMSETVKTIQQHTRTADGIWFVMQGGDENGEYRELAISQFDNCPCCDSLDSVGVVNSSYDDVMFSVSCYRCHLQIDGDTIAEAIERWNNAERLLADALNLTADLEAIRTAAAALAKFDAIIDSVGFVTDITSGQTLREAFDALKAALAKEKE